MKSFLESVNADLYDKYGSDISNLCLVFPSRRARLYFAESLCKHISKPIWQPESLAITDLIFRWAGRRPTDTLRLLAELFKVYQTLSDQVDSFDRFYYRGEMLLHDFDQIDKYLVPAKSLFQNLCDQKAMEGDYSFLTPEQVEAVRMFWSSFQPDKTNLQESFTKMWEIMYPLYRDFKNSLEEKGLAYEGMLYRKVAEDETLSVHHPLVLSYIFIGFNALNLCEHTIFRRLQARQLARFYWDWDDYYVNDSHQEAGRFLRKNMLAFPAADAGATYKNFSQPKEITSWLLPSDVLQTKIVPQIIQDNHLYTDKRTAVVLCNESLLIPLLSALSTVADDINITMGYPLVKTSLYSFTEALIMCYKSMRIHGGVQSYYHVEVSRLLSHPFISHLCPKAAEDLKREIITNNILFVPIETFSIDPWLKQIAQYPQDPDSFLQLLVHIFEAMDPDPILQPVIKLAIREMNKFRSVLHSCGLNITLSLFFNLLRQTLRSITVPFSGEPLKGVQVMGFLETRTLDFEHVVLLSTQEGFLPSAMESPSTIPYHLRVGFGLPVREEHEAMYAYYFYRLLQRAQKVSLLYSSGGDAMQTGEQSRYLLQLSAESPHTITQKRVSLPLILPAPAPEIVIDKSGICKERLLLYLDNDTDKFLTPSALNTYLQCPLQFYFKYIERIKEEMEVEEEADGRGLGTILHGVMESLYRPFLGYTVTSKELESLFGKIRKTVEEAIQTQYAPKSTPSQLFEQGRWLILADVLTTYISQVIKFDKERTPFRLKAVETEVKMRFRVSPQRTVPLGGVIDRIHEWQDTLYVVDYKTGKEQRSFESLESLFAPERNSQNSAVFQVFWYVMLYLEITTLEKVLPLLYYIRTLFKNETSTLLYDKSVKGEVCDIKPYMERYRELLGQKLDELFNWSMPFNQTKDTSHCTFCYYHRICQRV